MGARTLVPVCLQQARRLQAVRATEERTKQRLLGLADEACQDHDTQRIVAAALEGTFFNLIQVLRMFLLAGSHKSSRFRKYCFVINLTPTCMHACMHS